jgi:hypothetical protein
MQYAGDLSYGWRSMVKLNKIGEYSSILTNDSGRRRRRRRRRRTTTKQKVDPRFTK